MRKTLNFLTKIAPATEAKPKAKARRPRPSTADEQWLSSAVDIVAHMGKGGLFARWFSKPESWSAWLAFLKAVFALELNDGERATYQKCTGRTDLPAEGFQEAWLCVGRRGGKSLILALIATFLGGVLDWSEYLTGGERGTIMIIAADRRQARAIFRYVTALFKQTALSKLIQRETADALDLSNNVTIEILTASFRTVRGYTLIAALCDELAFWRSDESGANPDKEIISAIRPAMATIPGSMLLCASSPYARRGTLFDAHSRHFGKAGDPILVWQADTKTMNPTVPDRIIAEAFADDPASASAEYGAQFRTDVETFVSREVVQACTISGRYELPPEDGVSYFGFVDPSGGSSDSMTLAIAHKSEWTGKAVLDAVREIRAPFSPNAAVAELAPLLHDYRITTVCGDRYAGEWPRAQFRLHNIRYEPSVKTKSDIYADLLPMLNSGTAELLDLPRLQSQLSGLERRTARGGHDSMDHARGGHDDVANAAAGALTMTAGRGKITWSAVAGNKKLSTGNAESLGTWPRPVGLHERPPERLWPTGDVRFG
jgi:hypothetical protein